MFFVKSKSIRSLVSVAAAGIFGAVLFAGSADAAPATAQLSGKKSSLVALVYKDGAASALAHDHVIRSTNSSGEATWDTSDASACKLSVTIKSKSLVNDEPNTRRQYGLEGDLEEDARNEVGQHMRDKGQLDVANYPNITFVSTKVTSNGGEKYTIEGDFTLHGVTKRISFPATVKIKDNVLVGDAAFDIKQTDYGIEPYSAFLGAVKNKNVVSLKLHLVSQALPVAAPAAPAPVTP